MMLRWGGGALGVVLIIAVLVGPHYASPPASISSSSPAHELQIGDVVRYAGKAGGGAGNVTFTILGVYPVLRADGGVHETIAVRGAPGVDQARSFIDFIDAGTGRSVVRWTPCAIIKSDVCTTAGHLDWGTRGLPTLLGGSLEWGANVVPDGVQPAADECWICAEPLRVTRESLGDDQTRVRVDVIYVRNLTAWDIPRGEYVVGPLHPYPLSARIGKDEFVLEHLSRGATPVKMPEALPPLLPVATPVPYRDARPAEGPPSQDYPGWGEAYAAHPPPDGIVGCTTRSTRWFDSTFHANGVSTLRTEHRYVMAEVCEMRNGTFQEFTYTRTSAYPGTAVGASVPPSWTRTMSTVERPAAEDCVRMNIPIWTLVEQAMASPLWRGKLMGYSTYASPGCESHQLNALGEPRPGQGQTFSKTAEHIAIDLGTGRNVMAILYWDHPFAATLPR